MRLAIRRRRPDPVDEDLRIAVTIRWGLTTLEASTRRDAPRLWLHALRLHAVAQRRDHRVALEDNHALALRVPVRLHPGGSITSHWRPTAFDLEDPNLHRPVFTASARVSLPRQPSVAVEPRVSVFDDFVFDGTRYVLAPDSELHEDDRLR